MTLGAFQLRQLEELLNARLPERIAALEARLSVEAAAARIPESLQARNAQRVTDSQRLRHEIRRLLEAESGPQRGIAKRVRQALADTEIGRAARPSLRTVQHHIAQMRNTVCCAFTCFD